jgi:hypothetical protein
MEILKYINTQLYSINNYPVNINIKAETGDYMTDTFPIYSFVTVDAINIHNERMCCCLQIDIDTMDMFGVIRHNCKFVSSNSHIITVVTSSLGPITIPIIITEVGNMKFNVSILSKEEAS